MFQVGVLGYTSQKLYGPDDKDGTRLLMTGQRSFSVLGEAWGAVRFFDQTFTGYRQLINRPYINPQDSRMVPNTFEAYTLSGAASGVSYTGGFIAKMKTRNSDSFDWMSTVAGSKGTHKGVGFAGLTWDFTKNGYVRVDEQYVNDLFNNFYVDAKYPIAIDAQTLLRARRAVHGAEVDRQGVHRFLLDHHAGLQAAISRGPFGAQLYYTQNGKDFDTQNPFGDHASYLNLMHVAFNTAGEKTWAVGGNVNFASLGVPGSPPRQSMRAATIASTPRPVRDSRSQGDRPACRLRLRQGHIAQRAGGHAARRMAASGRLADRVPASRHPELRRSLLNPTAAGSWVSPQR